MASPYRPAKLFTLEQANAMLPLVRSITADMVALSRDIIERRERLRHLLAGRKHRSDPYSDELAQVEEEIEKDDVRLRGFVQELIELGVEPKSAPDGLIDFPCEMEGRVVYLCWKFGESEIQYWHSLEDGFSGRQPLVAGSVAG